jgi:hypothetical protein
MMGVQTSELGLAFGCEDNGMSKDHLRDLEEALLRKGWRIIAVHPGDDYRISATWEIRRSNSQPSEFIDFDGLDDMDCLPLEQSYGCDIRGRSARDEAASLYFRKPNKSRALWEQDVAAFVRALDNEGDAESGP